MITIAVSLNIGLALFCLGVAWKLLQFRRKLQRVTKALTLAEQRTDCVLHNAPYYILKGQTGTQYLHKQLFGLGPLQQRLDRLSVLYSLLRVGQRRWIGRPRRPLVWRPKI
jgi:hypothetical protein